MALGLCVDLEVQVGASATAVMLDVVSTGNHSAKAAFSLSFGTYMTYMTYIYIYI